MKTTNAIIILDGYGLSNQSSGNAIRQAHTPYLNGLFKYCPHAVLSASGQDVGLPDGQMGNSEVGHLNIGAGRIVYQDISLICNAINDGSFFLNPALLGAINNAKDKTLHLCGLLSDGGVHSSIQHLNALIKLAEINKIKNVYVHCITDGRDTATNSAKGFILDLEQYLLSSVGKIGSICGRYYTMDRNNNYDRVKKGYDCIFEAKGEHFSTSIDAIDQLYQRGLTDEFLTPCIIGDYKGFDNNDSFIFFNFRADRARQITKACTLPDFCEFNREQGYKNPFYVGMTLYDKSLKQVHTAFEPKDIKNTLSDVLSDNGLTQARVTETEKYAHVTFFFNGGVEAPNKNEDRFLVPSPNVKTYDLKPQMSANEVADKAIEQVGKYDVLIVNFANCDMVGHTGNINATIKAVEAVDQSLANLVDAILTNEGSALILADHGNAETMLYDNLTPMTAHTDNPVPIIYVGNKDIKLSNGRLCDVAPTFLHLLNIKIPPQMTGKSLLKQ